MSGGAGGGSPAPASCHTSPTARSGLFKRRLRCICCVRAAKLYPPPAWGRSAITSASITLVLRRVGSPIIPIPRACPNTPPSIMTNRRGALRYDFCGNPKGKGGWVGLMRSPARAKRYFDTNPVVFTSIVPLGRKHCSEVYIFYMYMHCRLSPRSRSLERQSRADFTLHQCRTIAKHPYLEKTRRAETVPPSTS